MCDTPKVIPSLTKERLHSDSGILRVGDAMRDELRARVNSEDTPDMDLLNLIDRYEAAKLGGYICYGIQPSHTPVSCNDVLAQWGISVHDYATMAKGAWSLKRVRSSGSPFCEYWNDEANKWCAFGTVYASELEAFGRAMLLVCNTLIK